MSAQTPLDLAFAAMEAAPEDDAARLRFYERLADGELFLLLAQEAEGDNVMPELFEVEDQRFVLVFDRAERLTAFVGGPAHYAALSGRMIANLAQGHGLGLGVNLGAMSETLVPSEAMGWLVDTLEHGPDEIEARPEEFSAPTGLPEVLIEALDTKLATAVGLARMAYLVGVTYENGTRGFMLGVIDAVNEAHAPLAKAVAEALTFSGVEAGMLDVGFFAAQDPVAASLARVGLRFDLPQPEEQAEYVPVKPGSDPDNPPILK